MRPAHQEDKVKGVQRSGFEHHCSGHISRLYVWEVVNDLMF